MPTAINRAEIATVLAAVLSRPVSGDRNVLRDELPEWDSVKNVELVFALEDRFEVQIPEAVLASFDSIDAIVRALEELRAA